MTITRDLRAARNIDFAPTLELEYSGGDLPLSGASFSMQVRLYPGAGGAPLAADADINLWNDAPHGNDPLLRVLTVIPFVSKGALAVFPTGLNQPEVGEADRFAYEIKVTYADGLQDSLWIGNFIVEPGVDAT